MQPTEGVAGLCHLRARERDSGGRLGEILKKCRSQIALLRREFAADAGNDQLCRHPHGPCQLRQFHRDRLASGVGICPALLQEESSRQTRRGCA